MSNCSGSGSSKGGGGASKGGGNANSIDKEIAIAALEKRTEGLSSSGAEALGNPIKSKTNDEIQAIIDKQFDRTYGGLIKRMKNDNDPKAQELFTNLKEALVSHRAHILTTYNAYQQLRFDETALRNKQAQINSQGRKDLNVIRGAEGLKNNPQAVQNISNRMDNAKKDWEIKQNLLLKLESRTTSVIQKSANAERELMDYLRDRDVKGAFK